MALRSESARCITSDAISGAAAGGAGGGGGGWGGRGTDTSPTPLPWLSPPKKPRVARCAGFVRPRRPPEAATRSDGTSVPFWWSEARDFRCYAAPPETVPPGIPNRSMLPRPTFNRCMTLRRRVPHRCPPELGGTAPGGRRETRVRFFDRSVGEPENAGVSSSRLVTAGLATLGALLVLAGVVLGFLPLNACGSPFVSSPVAGARASECQALVVTGEWVVGAVVAGFGLMSAAMVVRSLLQRGRPRSGVSRATSSSASAQRAEP